MIFSKDLLQKIQTLSRLFSENGLEMALLRIAFMTTRIVKPWIEIAVRQYIRKQNAEFFWDWNKIAVNCNPGLRIFGRKIVTNAER